MRKFLSGRCIVLHDFWKQYGAALHDVAEKNLAKLKAEYATQQKREMLVGMILENKVLDIIEAAAQIEQE